MDNKLIVSKFSDRSIKMEGISTLNTRTSSKLKMFLNSFDNSNIMFGEEEIILAYNIYNDNIVTSDINRIIQFLEASKIEYKLEESLDENRTNYLNKLEQVNLRKQILFDIKTSNFQDTKEFKNYKNFCDENLWIKLRDYQYEASYLLSMVKIGFDFSVPGAGKTIITYAAYNYLKKYDDLSNLLVIGPKNAYNAWHDEYVTCFNREPSFMNLSNHPISEVRDYLKASPSNHSEVTFVNIEKIRNLKKELSLFLENKKCLLVIDEGHKVKNPDAQATKTVLALAPICDYKIILTGTPMPNGYEDLYSLTNFISPMTEILPYNYNQLKMFTQKQATELQENKIMESIYPFYSRVSKKYLIRRGELLEPTNKVVYSEMNDDQRLIYDFLDGLITDFKNRWETEFAFTLMKAILIRKMQVSANPKLLNKRLIDTFEDLKSEFINVEDELEITNERLAEIKLQLEIADKQIMTEINASNIGKIIRKFANDKITVNKNQLAVDEIEKLILENKKVIIWDVFVGNMETIKKMIEEQLHITTEIVNGFVTGDDRQRIIDDFRFGDLKVLIASPATLAESISLHKCCQNAIYVNRNYNAAQFIQSKDRIHRINMPQGTTANYIYLINRDSVDEAVSARLEKKETRMLRILDSDEIIIGSLDSDDGSLMSSDDVLESYKR